MHSLDIQRLIQVLSRLPGLGPRSGKRMALHFLKNREKSLRPLVDALCLADQHIQTCSLCFNIDTQNPCSICHNPKRDASRICVVTDIADIWAMERTQHYKGHYHVLGGVLNAMDGIGPEQLKILELLRRAREDNIQEIILALNATLEGQTTIHYLSDLLKPLGAFSVTTLAHGVPVGGELDYLDEGTLIAAMNARRSVA